jgi:hypothetical protein
MGMQGNGVLFSSHIGTLIALFENSIDPKVIVGGSSGSIVGSIGRGLMNNSSIRNTPVEYITPSGEKILLTTPQKAALILAGSEEAMNGFLFLPGVDELFSRQLIQFIKGFVANIRGGQLPDQAHFKIMNIESTVGSAVLISAFFQLYDFKAILQGSNIKLSSPKPQYLAEYRERKDALSAAFRQYTKASQWSLAEMVGLLTDPSLAKVSADGKGQISTSESMARDRALKLKKLKTLMGEDRLFVPEDTTEEDLAKHNAMMQNPVSGTFFRIANGSLSFTNEAFKTLASFVQTNKDDAEFRTITNRILNAPFVFPDADLIMQAYQGLVPDPNNDNKPIFFPVPNGMIIHSTFRRGTVKSFSTAKDNPDLGTKEVAGKKTIMGFQGAKGFENLYQGYIVGQSLNGSDNSILKQMQTRRNNAWIDWNAIKKGTASDVSVPWRGITDKIAVTDLFSRAPFLVYSQPSLETARATIKASPVTNFSAFSPRETMPRNKDLGETEMESYMDPNQILLFGQGTTEQIGDFRNRGLNFGIQASAGEPGAFRRYAIKWTNSDIQLNSVDSEAAVKIESNTSAPPGFEEAQVIPFGGWGENIPLSSVAHLTECQSAPIFVSSALDAPGNDFQAGALVATVAGTYEKAAASSAERKAAIAEAEGHFQRLTAAAAYGRNFGQKIRLLNDVDFNSPCKQDATKSCSIDEVKKINEAITPLPYGESRLNLAIMGYQATMSSFQTANLGDAEVLAKLKQNLGRFNAFGQNAYSDQILDVRRWSNKDQPAWKRPVLASAPQKIKKYMDAIRNGEPASKDTK